MLSAQEVGQWDTETFAQRLHSALPRLRASEPNRDELKDKVAGRVRAAKMTGKTMVAILEELHAGKDLETLQLNATFMALFDDTKELFNKADMYLRSADAFAKTILQKVLFSEMATVDGLVVDIFEKMGLSATEGQDMREPSYDVRYPDDEVWLIKSGEERHVTYDSKACLKGVHGCSLAPQGWFRVGLKVRDPKVFESWHKAYHGTAAKNVKPIMGVGLKLPKEPIHGNAGAVDDKPVIYVSPSIEYSAHYVYTSTLKISAADAGAGDGGAADKEAPGKSGTSLEKHLELLNMQELKDGSYAQYVFEVRVNPTAYRVQGNTLHESLWDDWGLPFDKLVSSSNLEWLLEKEDDIVVTGVMIRLLPHKPRKHNAERLVEMKAHVKWSQEKLKPMRPRDYGDFTATRIEDAVWMYNAEPSSDVLGTQSYDPKKAWTPYSDEISAVIEAAYQDYSRLAFIGQPKGSPGPYFIDFGNQCDPSLRHAPQQRRADATKTEEWRQRAVRRVKRK